MAQLTCPVCSSRVPPKEPSSPGRQRLYCSRSCQAKRERVRAREPRPTIPCPACGVPFTQFRADKMTCSRHCWYVVRGVKLPGPLPSTVCALPGCGAEFIPQARRQRCCSEAHGKKLWNHLNPEPWNDKKRDHYHRRRAQKKATADVRPVLLAEIRERDGNRCHLCRKLVSVKLYPHPLSASLDHIVPLSLDGEHVPENVRLAHLRCNVAKGNRGGNEQLLLIG